MSDRLAEVQRRRTELVARAAQERDELGRLVGAVTQPLRAVGWISAAWRLASSRPLLVGGAVAAIVILRPSRAIAWTLRLWAGWQTFQRVRERFAGVLGTPGGGRTTVPETLTTSRARVTPR
jgi:hypothetical protein